MRSETSVIGTAFLEAARSGDLRLIKEIVAKFDDVDIQLFDKIRDIKGLTALHFACGIGKTDMCKYLVEQLKLDINAQAVHGITPLCSATIGEQLHIAKYLLDNGADIAKTGKRRCTALHYAAMNGHVNLLQLLISRGADVEAFSISGTPLVHAVALENKEVVRVLLQNNANPNIIKYKLSVPLIFSSGTSLEITDLLLKAGADPNISSCGVTPLHSAVNAQKLEIITLLLKAGANPNVLGTNGLVPLEKAAFMGNVQAVSILFPVTTPIPEIPNWSISGIMGYITSQEAEEKLVRVTKEMFNMAKTKGNDAFKEEDFYVAIYWYNLANSADPSDAIILSNRSLCYACTNSGINALSDAKACVNLKPDWPKAHYREGVAWKLLKNYHESVKSFSAALKLDPDNKDVRKAFWEAVEAEIAEMRI